MNYLKLIQRFWEFNRINNIGSTGISMYLYLLKIGFDNDINNFQISDVKVSKELGLTRKTVKSTKERLENYGLVKYQTRNGLPCYYKLILDFPMEFAEHRKIENLQTKKSKDSLRSENVLIPSQLQTSIGVVEIKNIPSLEEFIEYAQTLDVYVTESESLVKEKYHSWVSNGWQNNSARPITNWKSSLKSILPYMINSNIDDRQPSLTSIPNIMRPKI